jgi:hypothetical protein
MLRKDFVDSLFKANNSSELSNSRNIHCLFNHETQYLADKDSATLRVYDLSGGLTNLTATTTLTVPGPAGQAIDPIETSLVLISNYWGSEEDFYSDGRVNFIDTGIPAEDHGDHVDLVDGTPKIIENALLLDCGPSLSWYFSQRQDCSVL